MKHKVKTKLNTISQRRFRDVCMYLCMYVCVCVRACVRACVHARACVCVPCLHAYMQFFIYLCMYVPLSSAIFTFSEIGARHSLDRR